MSNKLKSIFSDEEIVFNGELTFKDKESHDQFMNAIERVYEEGKTLSVDGVQSIKTEIRTGDKSYATEEHKMLDHVVIAPSKEDVPLEVETEFGKKEMHFKRYAVNKGVVLETDENAVVYLKLFFESLTENTTMSYRVHVENAKSVSELIEEYAKIVAFYNKIFRKDIQKMKGGAAVENIKLFFSEMLNRYKKLRFLEKEFDIQFDPKDLVQNEDCWLDVEELYLLLQEKKVVRLNAKLTETQTTSMTINQHKELINEGAALQVTFISKVTYLIWEKRITLYSANLLSNAIVKETHTLPNDEVKILYGEEDSRPMYISFRAFSVEEDAKKEMEQIMNHKEEYVDALTTIEYLKKEKNSGD